jgi:hypothetical protein
MFKPLKLNKFNPLRYPLGQDVLIALSLALLLKFPMVWLIKLSFSQQIGYMIYLIFSSIFILIVLCVKSFSKGLDFKWQSSIFVVISSLSLIILLDFFNLKDSLYIFIYMVYFLSYEFLFQSTVHTILVFKELCKELIKEIIKLNNVLFMDNNGGSNSGSASRGGIGYSSGGSAGRGRSTPGPSIGGIGSYISTGNIRETDSNNRGVKRDLQAYLSDIAQKALKHGNLNSNPENAPNPNNTTPNTVGPAPTRLKPTVFNMLNSSPITPIASTSTAISTKPITSNPSMGGYWSTVISTKPTTSNTSIASAAASNTPTTSSKSTTISTSSVPVASSVSTASRVPTSPSTAYRVLTSAPTASSSLPSIPNTTVVSRPTVVPSAPWEQPELSSLARLRAHLSDPNNSLKPTTYTPLAPAPKIPPMIDPTVWDTRDFTFTSTNLVDKKRRAEWAANNLETRLNTYLQNRHAELQISTRTNVPYNTDVSLKTILPFINFKNITSQMLNDREISNLQRCILEFMEDNPQYKKTRIVVNQTRAFITLLRNYANN